MQADDYIIRARIVVSDESRPGTRAAEDRLDRVERKGLSVSAALTRAMAAVGGVYALARATSGIVALNDQLDVARIGVASLFQANAGVQFAQGMRIARSELTLLQKDAAAGVGELDNYLSGYRAVLGKTLAAGFGPDQARRLVRLGIAAGAASGSDLNTVPMDLRQALTSGASATETPIIMQALDAAGITSQRFNAMGSAERITTLIDAFGAYDEASEAFGRTFGAQADTFRDALKQGLRAVTQPMFERWTDQLRSVNDWLERNSDVVDRIAATLGKMLLEAYERLPVILSGLAGMAAAGVARRGVSAVGGVVQMASAAGAGGPYALLASLGIMTAVAAAAASLQAAWRTYPETLRSLMETGAGALDSLHRLQQVLDSMSSSGSALADVGYYVSAFFTGLVYVIDQSLKGLGAVIIQVDWAIRTSLSGLQALLDTFRGDWAGGEQRARERQVGLDRAWEERMRAMFAPRSGAGEEEDALAGLAQPSTVVNIGNVNVRVDTEVNADPGRVALAWDEMLDKALRTPRQARRLSGPIGEL